MEPKLNTKRIRHYHSFEEAQAAEDEFAAAQDPMDRMAATLKIIKAIYSYRPNQNMAPKKFVIRRLY